MTPEEATRRIVKSRNTLALYKRMPAGVVHVEGTMHLANAEIATLCDIAQRLPHKAASIASLCNHWEEYRDRLRGKAN